jgi:hypothetical protein
VSLKIYDKLDAHFKALATGFSDTTRDNVSCGTTPRKSCQSRISKAQKEHEKYPHDKKIVGLH